MERPDAPGLTPFQPTGPYPQVMLDLPTGAALPLSAVARGERIVIDGSLHGGDGNPIVDAMIEIWQADAEGRYPHPLDPRGADADPGFWGYRRVATDQDGRFRIETIKPGAVLLQPGSDTRQAPHILGGIYGGGIPYRYSTRLYFEGEALNDSDPVLMLVPEPRRVTLIAKREGATYRFPIVLQGEGETVFFDL